MKFLKVKQFICVFTTCLSKYCIPMDHVTYMQLLTSPTVCVYSAHCGATAQCFICDAGSARDCHVYGLE